MDRAASLLPPSRAGGGRAPLPPASGRPIVVTRYGPHERVWQTRIGDVALVQRARDAMSDALRLRAWARTGREPRFNHAAVVVGIRGELVEATIHGVVHGELGAYDGERWVLRVLEDLTERELAARAVLAEVGPRRSIAAVLGACVGLGGAWTAPTLAAFSLHCAGIELGDHVRVGLEDLHAWAANGSVAPATRGDWRRRW